MGIVAISSIRSRCLSKRAPRDWAALGLLGLFLLTGCATDKEAQIRKLQARSAYETGWIHINEKRIALGLASLQEAVGLDPEKAAYHTGLGFVYLNLKQLPQAMEALRKAIELDPSDATAYLYLGVAHAEAGRWEEAVQEYRKALAFPGAVVTVLANENLGWAYYNLGRLKEAEEVLMFTLRLEPSMASAHYHLGLVLLKAGRKEEARAAFSKARDQAPESEFGLAAREHLRALESQ